MALRLSSYWNDNDFLAEFEHEIFSLLSVGTRIHRLLNAGAQRDVSKHGVDSNIDETRSENSELMSLELMTAIFRRDVKKVKQLLERGADPRYRDYDNRTPLHLAASEGLADVGQVLCQYAIDLQARDRFVLVAQLHVTFDTSFSFNTV